MALRARYISLCTGGGGLDLGVELAVPGARAVCYVEREVFACAHLVEAMQAGWLADAPVWTDARTFDGRPWRGLVDGVIGGIPCQPHSLAGRKRGSLDERDLWTPTRRIIAQARPWFVLIENVGGMLAAGADDIAGAERVLRDLRRLGYAVEAGLFTAEEVGAPHRRERVFILAVADPGRSEWRPRDEGLLADRDQAGRGQGAGGARQSGPHVADAGQRPDERRGGPGEAPGAAGAAQSAGDQRQWGGNAAGDGREDVADAHDTGSQGHGLDGERAGECAPRPRGVELVHPALDGWGEGRPAPEFRGGWSAASISGCTVELPPRFEGSLHPRRRSEGRGAPDTGGGGIGLFPPGLGDAGCWAAVLAERPDLAPATEPGVRGVADGLASRVDQLRMLGNGVVPLAAAHAIRTLVDRHAALGHPGADELIRMMEE